MFAEHWGFASIAGRALRRLIAFVMAALGVCTVQARPACLSGDDPARSLWAAADFDGDRSVDVAQVTIPPGGGRAVTGVDVFALCAGQIPRVSGLLPRMGLVLSARDVDADDDQDLVLKEAFAGQTLGVWLNDGQGGFSMAAPSDYPGTLGRLPILGKHSEAVRDAAACPSPKCVVLDARRVDAGLAAPDCAGLLARSLAPAAAGLRGACRDRAPPNFSH